MFFLNIKLFQKRLPMQILFHSLRVICKYVSSPDFTYFLYDLNIFSFTNFLEHLIRDIFLIYYWWYITPYNFYSATHICFLYKLARWNNRFRDYIRMASFSGVIGIARARARIELKYQVQITRGRCPGSTEVWRARATTADSSSPRGTWRSV